jgi:two-component system NtrC family sensor kinase
LALTLPIEVLLRRMRELCGLVAASLGLIVLISWFSRSATLASTASEPIPVAPTSALSFVLLGAALGLLSLEPRPHWVLRTVRAIIFLVAASIMVRLFGNATDTDSGTERWLFMPSGISLPQGPGGQMAVQTACAFLMAGMAFLLLTVSRENMAAANAAGYLGAGVATLGLVFVLSYVYGAPFFTEPIIPMALHSALAFVALGGGLIATAGPKAAPLRLLVGPSVQAQLLRAFVPFTILVVAGVSGVMHFAGRNFQASPAALINSIVAVSSVAFVSFLCVRLADYVGADLERVQHELRQAEHASRGYAGELQMLNASLERRVQERTAALRESALSERQAHEELKKAQSQLVQNEKLAALGQLVAGIAHEINNPLSFVYNNVVVLERDVASLRDLLLLYRQAEPLLERELPDVAARLKQSSEDMDLEYTLENLQGLATRAREGLRRIQQIVKDLRAFARLDESDLQETDLNANIVSTLNLIQGEARSRQVELVTDLGPIPTVVCFPARINQVILNLVVNAIDACAAGNRVTVRTRADGPDVLLEVEDTGSGIAPAIRERIFDPFFTTKPQGKGTGLGLSISYGIIQGHGGSIHVDSTLGQGTCFRIRLPRVAILSERRPTRERSPR